MSKIAKFIVALQDNAGDPTAATVAGSLHYATVDGTAVAGVDYTATSGVLAFGVGDTAHVIEVPILADPAAPIDKAFTLALSAPNAIGLPAVTSKRFAISIGDGTDLTVTISAASLITAPLPVITPLSALGSQFVDASGTPVRLCGIAWYGFDGTDLIPHGLYQGRGYKDVLDQIVNLGFNAVRIPFSDDMLTSTVTFVSTSGDQFVDPHANPDILGLTPLQAFDAIVYYASTIGLRILLDHHRISMTSTGTSYDASGFGTDGWPDVDPASGTLYLYGGSATPRPYTAATWAAMWSSLATHCTTDHTIPGITGAGQYASNATLRATILGYEPHNEPYRPSWATWAALCEALFPIVHAIAPDWMMIVQGVGASADGTDTYWFGGYLRSVGSSSVDGSARPIAVTPQNKVGYSAHEYGLSVSPQSWLSSVADSNGVAGYPVLPDRSVPDYPQNLEAVRELYYGSIFTQGTAPMIVSEFGFGGGYDTNTGALDPLQLPANAAFELQWADSMVRYLNGSRNDGSSILTGTALGMSYSYWSVNPESGNPLGGLLQGSDYLTVQAGKMDHLLPLIALQ